MSTLPREDFVTNLLPTVALCVVDVSWRVILWRGIVELR